MFKRIFILAFLTSLFSCNTETKTEDKISVSKTLLSEIDSLRTPAATVYITDTSNVTFTTSVPDTSEFNNLLANKGIVSRSGDTLKIKLNSGSIKQYVNTPYIEESEYAEGFTDYRYSGNLKNIGYHLLFVSYHESFSYLLVNAATGKETYTCGSPEISPYLTKIMCGCFDLQAGFVFNGLQLFEVKKDSLKPLWSRELTKWGPNKLCWINNNDLVGEKLCVDSASGEVITSLIKLSNCK